MKIDIARVLQAAINAALEGQSSNGQAHNSNGQANPTRWRLSAGRAVLMGVGLVAAGRLAAPKGRELLDALEQKIEELDSDDQDEPQESDEDYYDEEEPEDENDEDFDEEEPEDDPPRTRKRARSPARSRS